MLKINQQKEENKKGAQGKGDTQGRHKERLTKKRLSHKGRLTKKGKLLHTGIGIFESSLPIQFFIILHKLRLWLGLSGMRARCFLRGLLAPCSGVPGALALLLFSSANKQVNNQVIKQVHKQVIRQVNKQVIKQVYYVSLPYLYITRHTPGASSVHTRSSGFLNILPQVIISYIISQIIISHRKSSIFTKKKSIVIRHN